MKPFFTLLSAILLTIQGYTQELKQVSFLDGANLSHLSVLIDYNVLVRISADGKILEWGTELLSDRGNYYARQLQPYMGRVEYYSPESDSAYRGKVKSIGTCSITYYGSFEEAGKRGKLKSMGPMTFDYFSNYDEKSLQGRLKQAGSLSMDYYRSYDMEAFRGKLKSLGSMQVTYYSAIDDKYNAGKLKSFGSANYTWYPEFDRARGSLKSNNYRQPIGGLVIVLR